MEAVHREATIEVTVADAEGALAGRTDERGTSRSEFVRRGLFAGGALLVGGVAIGGLPALVTGAPSADQDVKILNFALLLEYQQTAFYKEAAEKKAIGGELLRFAQTVADHEAQHADYVKKLLGSKAQKAPTFQFHDLTTDPKKFTKAAIALEDTAVAAYNGQATNLTKPTLKDVARVVSVDARHAAWIRAIAGMTPASQATDPLGTPEQATKAIARTGITTVR